MDRERQKKAPIYEALEEFKKKRVVPFDVPGHKRGRGNPELVQLLGEKCVSLDVNSMKPLDNLCHPVSVIREAEELAAEAFGAASAYLMVGGTTSAVQSMILSVVKAGDKIILPRNVHKSVINALVLCGGIPIYVNPEMNQRLGISLDMIYGSAGTLYFDDLPAHIDGNPLQIMAFVFFFTGMAFKLSLVPFHLWTADVYEGAPSTVTAYLSVVSKGSAAFVLLIILIKVFAPMINDWQEVLYWVTIASITIANIFAIRQQNLKRLMAFSSISQAGYIMLGVIGGTAQGMTALVYYVLVYAAANLGVFAVITIVALRSQKFTLEDYAGLYKTNPKIALLMTLSLFSLAGIPPFAGFFSKFFIFMATFDAGFHLLVFIALVNTVISLYYYLLIVKAMYITPSENPIPTFRSDRCTKWGLALCTLGIIGLGIASVVYQSIDKLAFGI